MDQITKAKINQILNYAKQLIGTKYKWWTSDSCTYETEEPFWVSNTLAPSAIKILNSSCNCAGLINLMRRAAGKDIAYLNDKYMYAGGTWAWTDYFDKKSLLEKFDSAKLYPNGTLLVRKYRDVNDQGHLAVIYASNNDPSKCLIIHSYSNTPYSSTNTMAEPGIVIEPIIVSNNWLIDGYYEFCVLPQNWLL